jgi:hypothetical protein
VGKRERKEKNIILRNGEKEKSVKGTMKGNKGRNKRRERRGEKRERKKEKEIN